MERADAGDGGGSREVGIQEVVELTGISAFTIRYYDKCGFFPDLKRGKRGVRSFAAADIRQLLLVDALRKSGLSIEGIRYYVRLSRAENRSADRLAIVQTQISALEYQIAESRESLDLLKKEAEALQSDGSAASG